RVCADPTLPTACRRRAVSTPLSPPPRSAPPRLLPSSPTRRPSDLSALGTASLQRGPNPVGVEPDPPAPPLRHSDIRTLRHSPPSTRTPHFGTPVTTKPPSPPPP